MYKVERYRYKGENNEEFTNGKVYEVRKSKDGFQSFIETNDGERNLFILKLSQQNDIANELLKQFTREEEVIYKNYKEYKQSKK